MYHLDGTDYLKEKYYHKTKSVCPECLNKIDAEIIEENENTANFIIKKAELI